MCVRHGPMEPVEGVREVQTLARTYNSIYEENREREMLMKRQAEHDPLTGLLNRGPFDRILSLYLKDRAAFTEGTDENLFEHADRALYETKERGRSGCTVYAGQ